MLGRADASVVRLVGAQQEKSQTGGADARRRRHKEEARKHRVGERHARICGDDDEPPVRTASCSCCAEGQGVRRTGSGWPGNGPRGGRQRTARWPSGGGWWCGASNARVRSGQRIDWKRARSGESSNNRGQERGRGRREFNTFCRPQAWRWPLFHVVNTSRHVPLPLLSKSAHRSPAARSRRCATPQGCSPPRCSPRRACCTLSRPWRAAATRLRVSGESARATFKKDRIPARFSTEL
jgi:hypothetical protein